MQTIEIDLTESDLELFRKKIIDNNETVEWIFPSNNGEDFKIKFIPYKEE